MGGPIGTLQGPEHAHRGTGDKCSHGDWGQLATGSLGTNAHKGTGDKCSQGDCGQMLTGGLGTNAHRGTGDKCSQGSLGTEPPNCGPTYAMRGVWF